MDIRFGLVNVQGQHMRADNGVTIGGPASAGEATLQAARKEQDELDKLDDDELLDFLQHVLALRWADDIMYAYRLSTWIKFETILGRFQETFFYGPKLRLIQTKTAEAFGFRFSTRGNKLQMRNKMGCIVAPQDRMSGGWVRDTAAYHGGEQYMSPQTRAGVAKGHLTRPLVAGGMEEDSLIQMVARTLLELVRVNYDPKLLKRMVKKIAQQNGLNLKGIEAMLGWTQLQQNVWRELFDQQELFNRELEKLDVYLADLWHE